MNYRIITRIACKLMAFYYFIRTFMYLPYLISTLINLSDRMGNMSVQIIIPLSMIGPTLIIAVLLWIFADKISVMIVKEPLENHEVHEINYKTITAIAFAVAGLLTLTNSIPDLASVISQYLILARDSEISMNNYMNKEFTPKIIGDTIKTVIGLWLLFGSKGIAHIIISFRELGSDRIEETKQ